MPYITRLCAIWVKRGKEGAGTLHVSSKKVGIRLVYGVDEALSLTLDEGAQRVQIRIKMSLNC